MNTIYQMNANELDIGVLESIRAAYKDKQIEIVVSEIDETEYLMRSPANREFLLRAIERVEAGVGIVTPDQEEFQ